ncbi:hypothetical protein DFH09DRAFT_1312757 [Mycena vulgaris]|nr:hypothetical protein DFH09DRAFT_1312757 [Mycena vulgaris]
MISSPASVLQVQRICDYIIDFLHESPTDLKSCALVSQTFTSPAQHHLSREINLETAWDSLDTPTPCGLVRHLGISFDVAILAEIANIQFTHVDTLLLYGEMDPHQLARIISPVANLIGLPTLRMLKLWRITLNMDNLQAMFGNRAGSPPALISLDDVTLHSLRSPRAPLADPRVPRVALTGMELSALSPLHPIRQDLGWLLHPLFPFDVSRLNIVCVQHREAFFSVLRRKLATRQNRHSPHPTLPDSWKYAVPCPPSPPPPGRNGSATVAPVASVPSSGQVLRTKNYEDDTKIKFATHALAGCNNPDAVLDGLDRDLQEFKDYRNNKKKLRKWLKPMLHLIGSPSETAGEAAGVSVPFAKAAFIALGVLVQAAKNVSARYDSIIDLCELLHSFLERLRVYMSAQLPSNMQEIVIRILAHLLSVFALMTKEIKHNRFGEIAVDCKHIWMPLKKLNDLIGTEQSMGVASAMVFSGEILDHLHGLVLDANEGVMQQLSDLRISTTVDGSVRSWLKAPDPRTNHNTARFLHEGHTGGWLVRSFEYKSWKTTSSSLFWINGKPGAGKTIICSTVIEDMLAISGGVLAYFYFYHGEPDKRSLRGMLSSIISQLEEQLLDCSHSDGMFRWVTCQLDDLRECLLRDLQVTLNNLPATLDATYERILSRIHATNKPHARRLFNWLAFSFRPLHVAELAQVLAINFMDDARATFEEDYIEPDPREAISRVCLSLVHITPDGIVQFTHFSVKEFFVSERIQSMPSISLFRIEAGMAHTIIAASCLAYLLWVSCMDDIPDDEGEIEIGYPLIQYSVQYAIHAQFNLVSDSVHKMLVNLFVEDSHQWMFWISRCREVSGPQNGSTLYWAAKLGFLRIMQLLLEHGADVNTQGGWYGTALQVASAYGFVDLVRLLFQHGADVNAQGGENGTALQVALEHGHLDLARLLLEHGADVNAQGGWYGNALGVASMHGHLDLAQLLLEHGADVNAQDKDNITALEVASLHGHLDNARLLLEHGADINAESGAKGTALHAASWSGHLDLARLLLKHGADVNAQGGQNRTALQVASLRGHLDLARLLLEHGADIKVQGGRYGTALQAASVYGHLDLARLLLEHGAELNAQGGQYGTALQVASSHGHIDLARLLLEHGADVNMQGGLCGNADAASRMAS